MRERERELNCLGSYPLLVRELYQGKTLCHSYGY